METPTVERHGGVVTVTLNRPDQRNALTSVMFGELPDTFTDVDERVDDRVLILAGAADTFCVEADLTEPAPHHHLLYMRWVGDSALALHRLPKPTIAKVNGIAVGAGCNLALGCDLVVASEDARFSQIFARRGLSLECGDSWPLPRLIGIPRAKELAFFADVMSSKEAPEIGLVNRVVPLQISIASCPTGPPASRLVRP